MKNDSQFESPGSPKKCIRKCCRLLTQSNKTFADIYRIVFSRDGVLCETSGARGLICYTYGDFRAAVDRVSSSLYRRLGADGYVAIYGKNSFEWTVAFWAILKSGNKPFLINVQHPPKTIVSLLDTLGCEVILCTDERLSGLGKQDLRYTDLASDAALSEPPVFADRIALSTSGTTLNEKICIYTGEVVSNQILNAPQIVKAIPSIQSTYEGKLKMLMVLPLYHIFGLEASYLWFLIFGAVFVFPPSLAPNALLGVIKRHKITHVFSVPLFWQSVEKNAKKELDSLNEPTRKKLDRAMNSSINLQKKHAALGKAFAKRVLRPVRNRLFGDSVQFCISGGSHVATETLRFVNALGYPLYNGYGMTEIGIISANFTSSMERRLTPSIGKIFASVSARIGNEGHLEVQGSSICTEMIVNGERMTINGWFDTGDIVTENAYGDFEIAGRASDLVISADGENLNPDIAQSALSLSSLPAFAVLGNEKNDALILVVQIPKDMMGFQIEAIKAEVVRETEKLPSAYRIRRIYYTTDALLEQNEIKISRKQLRRRIDNGEIRFLESFPKTDDQPQINTAIAQKLREIFSEVLRLRADEINPTDHFMNDLGGTSLEYYDVIYRIEEHFGVKLDFQCESFGYTLSDFERILKEKTDL